MNHQTQYELIDKIIRKSTDMLQLFPEQYALLSETPLFIHYNENQLNNSDFESYLNTIESQLTEFSLLKKTKKNSF
jgi:hypothetical protein